MKTEMELRREELEENPHPRLAVCLCLDTSGSMQGEPIQELNEGIEFLFNAIRMHEEARYAAEIAVVTFGEDRAEKALDFAFIERQQVPQFRASGGTPMGAGVNLALDLLAKAGREYTNLGIERYKPWLVLITDGEPTELPEITQNAAQRVCDLVNRGRLSVFPIGVGPAANRTVLASFSPRREPVRLKGTNFESFFEWLGKSVTKISQSQPDDNVPMEAGVDKWAEQWREN